MGAYIEMSDLAGPIDPRHKVDRNVLSPGLRKRLELAEKTCDDIVVNAHKGFPMKIDEARALCESRGLVCRVVQTMIRPSPRNAPNGMAVMSPSTREASYCPPDSELGPIGCSSTFTTNVYCIPKAGMAITADLKIDRVNLTLLPEGWVLSAEVY